VTNRLPIGQRLVQQGHIDAWQLQSALAHQQRWGGRLGEALVGLGFLPEEVVLSEVARQLGVPYLDVAQRWWRPRWSSSSRRS
jgi:type IV pilus assembly protein PilB